MDIGFKAFMKAGESKFKSVQKDLFGALGDKEGEEKEKGEGAEEEGEEDPEIAEARREAEEKRAEKHRKMEEERETMRQQIRDKYGIKKKVIEKPEEDPGMDGRLGRKRKTPEEMAAEANADEEDDEFSTSMFPKSMDEFKTKVTELPGSVMNSVSEATDKCSLQ